MQDAAFEDAHLLFSLWPSPRTTESTQAARRNGAGPGRQFCRQTNAALRKARAEQHIMQSSPHSARRSAALRMRARASRAHLGARGASVARTSPAGPAGGPRGSERAVQVRWPRRRSASQGPRGPPSSARWVPEISARSTSSDCRRLLAATRALLRSQRRDKEKSFCFSPADGNSAA